MNKIIVILLCGLLLFGCASKQVKMPNHTGTSTVVGSILGGTLGGLTGGMLGLLALGNGAGAVTGLLVGAVAGALDGGMLANGISKVLTTRSK